MTSISGISPVSTGSSTAISPSSGAATSSAARAQQPAAIESEDQQIVVTLGGGTSSSLPLIYTATGALQSGIKTAPNASAASSTPSLDQQIVSQALGFTSQSTGSNLLDDPTFGGTLTSAVNQEQQAQKLTVSAAPTRSFQLAALAVNQDQKIINSVL